MKRWMMALAGVVTTGMGGYALAQGVSALAQLRTGEWQVREIGATVPARSICVGDTRRLLQIEHGGAACNHRTIATGAKAATVRYTCPGAGTGTTELAVESGSIVRLHTQGVSRGAPFDTTYEARFSGACGPGLAKR